MKKCLILAGCALMLALSCAKESDAPEALQEGVETFYATTESVDAKVFADDQLRVLWHEKDLVSIFNKYTYNKAYKFNGNTGDNAGSFSEVPSGDFVTGNALPLVYAIYPYDAETNISNDGIISLKFPATQTYSKNSFGLGANPMVSVSEDNNLLFKNVGGYLMLKFYGEACIKTIELQSSKKIAGPATVTMDLGGTPVITMADNASSTITLDCGAGILVGSTEENYTEFWFALPPVSFNRGFTVKVTDVYGQSFSKKTNNALTIERNHLEKMAPIELNMPHQSSSDNIVFADASVKSWLVGKFDTNNDGELSFAEAAAVTDRQFGACFDCSSGSPDKTYPDPPITTFNEMKYFTGLTSVPDACFMFCSELEEVTLPQGISSIGSWAFEGCTKLKALDVPASCKEIGYYAFSSCPSLKTLIFRSPDNLNMHYSSFGSMGNCPASSLTIYAENAFDIGMNYSGAANGGFSIGGTVYVPAKSIVRYQELWHQLERQIKPIEETFDEIIVFADPNVKNWIVKWTSMDDVPFDANGDGEISYREAAAITELPPDWFDPSREFTIGKAPSIVSFNEFEYFSSVGYVPFGCFSGCKDLTSIRIPRSVYWLADRSFYDCSSLADFIAPPSMTSLGIGAFSGCSNLKNVTMYADHLTFSGFCFSDCNLTSLTVYSRSLPEYCGDPMGSDSLYKHIFFDGQVQTMYVPDPSSYQNDAYWSQASVGTYAQIPDYDQYYRTHYD